VSLGGWPKEEYAPGDENLSGKKEGSSPAGWRLAQHR
jgi:hypothetical protein